MTSLSPLRTSTLQLQFRLPTQLQFVIFSLEEFQFQFLALKLRQAVFQFQFPISRSLFSSFRISICRVQGSEFQFEVPELQFPAPVLLKLFKSSPILSKMPPRAPQRRPGSPFGPLENSTKSTRILRNEPIPPKRCSRSLRPLPPTPKAKLRHSESYATANGVRAIYRVVNGLLLKFGLKRSASCVSSS